MNTLVGTISNIQSTDHLSYVTVTVGNDKPINAVILETPATLSYLSLNKKVRILFKETEVVLSLTKSDSNSLENSLEGEINKIDQGDILTRIECQTDAGSVCSIITTPAFKKLNLEIGHSIAVSINASEIMLSE